MSALSVTTLVIAFILLNLANSEEDVAPDHDKKSSVCFPDGMKSVCRLESTLYGNIDYISHGDFINRRGLHDKPNSKELFDFDNLMIYVFTEQGCSAFQIPPQLSFYPCLPDDTEFKTRYQVRRKGGKGWRFVGEWAFDRPFVDSNYSIDDGSVSTFTFVIDEITQLPDSYRIDHPDGSKDVVTMNATLFDYSTTPVLFDLDISQCVGPDFHTEL